MANNTEINLGYNTTNNLPQISYILNNRKSNDILCLNYIYMLKSRISKNSCQYVCRFKGCHASISLKIGVLENDTIGPLVPFVPTCLQMNYIGHEVYII